MSTLKVDTITKSDGTGSLSVPAETGSLVTTAAGSVESAITTQLGRRNLIINGAMQVAQRGTGPETVTTSAGFRSVDRWKTDIDGSSGHDWSHEQSTDAPAGFRNSSKVTIVTNGSQPSGTSDRHQFYYQAEASDIGSFCWGTSDAKPITLSFWVRSSVTGTFGVKLDRNTTSDTQYYNTSYVINSADTWEHKTITVQGVTTLDPVTTATSNGLLLEFGIGYASGYEGSSVQNTWQTSTAIQVPSGTVYLPATSGATWYITGVQLEVGSVATPFEHRSYGEELALCQRYYQTNVSKYHNWTVTIYSSTAAYGNIQLEATMRTNPTIDLSGTSTTNIYYNGTNTSFTSLTAEQISVCSFGVVVNGASGMTGGQAGLVYPIFTADAEL